MESSTRTQVDACQICIMMTMCTSWCAELSPLRPRGRRLLGWPRTTLGCSPPLDARELLTRGIPQPRNSWRVPELILTVPVGSDTEALNPGIPQLRNFSTEEFLGSGAPEHPRVVSIQGWFLAGPRLAIPREAFSPPQVCTTRGQLRWDAHATKNTSRQGCSCPG